MYNIKQAAARAGVSVPVLRAWERRYGVVQPARTASGYRLFDDAAVDRIRAMRSLIAQGWAPSAAAAAIVAGRVDPAVESAAMPVPPDGAGGGSIGPGYGDGDLVPSRRPESDELSARFIAAARSMEPGAVDAVLDDLFARGSFERVATDLLFPALERLGDAWAAGELGVAGEHMASNAVLRRLGLSLDAAASAERRDGRVVVGLPPGGRHELGALAFAVAARRAGLPVTYVGPDLPVDDWIGAAEGASAAVIGVVTPRDRGPALDVARRLREAHPDLMIALGGRATPAKLDGSGADRLPDLLTEAVASVAAHVEASRVG